MLLSRLVFVTLTDRRVAEKQNRTPERERERERGVQRERVVLREREGGGVLRERERRRPTVLSTHSHLMRAMLYTLRLRVSAGDYCHLLCLQFGVGGWGGENCVWHKGKTSICSLAWCVCIVDSRQVYVAV